MRSTARWFVPCAMIFSLLALPACQENIDDEDLSSTFPSIISFTPLIGNSDITDLITPDDPATAINEFEAVFRADVLVVTIQGDARSSAGIGFGSDVILTGYTVAYTPLDGAADALFPVDWVAAINQEIPAGGSKTFTIEIVRLQDKAGGALLDLDCTFGFGACSAPRRAVVTVAFTGADISGHPVAVTGNLTIVFADFGDADGEDPGLL